MFFKYFVFAGSVMTLETCLGILLFPRYFLFLFNKRGAQAFCNENSQLLVKSASRVSRRPISGRLVMTTDAAS